MGSYRQFGVQVFRLISLSYNKRSARSRTLQPWFPGIHPAILSTGGLGRALTTLARRRRCRWNSRLVSTTKSPNPRKWPIIRSLPKALINAANHIRASQVTMCAQSDRSLLHLSIRDDGVGGANCAKGSGLTGLRDRVEAPADRWKSTVTPDVGPRQSSKSPTKFSDRRVVTLEGRHRRSER